MSLHTITLGQMLKIPAVIISMIYNAYNNNMVPNYITELTLQMHRGYVVHRI